MCGHVGHIYASCEVPPDSCRCIEWAGGWQLGSWLCIDDCRVAILLFCRSLGSEGIASFHSPWINWFKQGREYWMFIELLWILYYLHILYIRCQPILRYLGPRTCRFFPPPIIYKTERGAPIMCYCAHWEPTTPHAQYSKKNLLNPVYFYIAILYMCSWRVDAGRIETQDGLSWRGTGCHWLHPHGWVVPKSRSFILCHDPSKSKLLVCMHYGGARMLISGLAFSN